MKNPATQSGKLFKQAQVDAALRQRIVSGAYPPGSAIPTRSQLMAEFRVSIVTIQKAMDRLEQDGFVQSKWGSGTFVADHPPHLSRYALAFPVRPGGVLHWTTWWTILHQAAIGVMRSEPGKSVAAYYDITNHADVEDCQRLLADARAHRLAGIILLSAPQLMVHSPLADDDCPVPRVYIGGNSRSWKIPGVAMKSEDYLDKALGHAAARGKRRPVYIGPMYGPETTWKAWAAACQRYEMQPERRQLLMTPIEPAEAVRHLTQTVMLLPPEHRPDVLVVGDDHLVEGATLGLLSMGLPERDWPLVIAHANFPYPPKAHVPVTYLGYDSAAVIRACIDVLDAQRRGETVPEITWVPSCLGHDRPAAETPIGLDSLAFHHVAEG